MSSSGESLRRRTVVVDVKLSSALDVVEEDEREDGSEDEEEE